MTLPSLQKEPLNIISLGWFCGVAQELERRGLRHASFPFDWLLSDIKGIEAILDNSFQCLLDPAHLRQDTIHTNHYYNDSLGFSFFHDFSSQYTLEEQLPEIKHKYTRRIQRFWTTIRKPCGFIRYIKDKEEYEYLSRERKKFEQRFKKFNPEHFFFYIVNSDIAEKSDFAFVVPKDNNDTVARTFMRKTPTLERTLIHIFPLKYLLSNMMKTNAYTQSPHFLYNLKTHIKRVIVMCRVTRIWIREKQKKHLKNKKSR